MLAKNYLSQPLSILYKKEYLNNSFKEKGIEFIKKIKSSALEQIGTNEWLLDSTKKTAKEKMKSITISVGWPDTNIKYFFPNLETDNLLKNVYLLSTANSIQEIYYINNKSTPGKYWFEPSYLVNAFYYNEINEFIIPAGNLFYPFFGKSIGWNHGGLGCIIGHEMIHAYDNDGKRYNQYGYYKNWWLSRDNRRFKIYSKKLIELYNKSKLFKKHINGKATLNENLADLGGLHISLESLKKEIKNYSYEERINELQQFFISYAVSWRTKEEKKFTLYGLIVDHHSPPEFRVNNIVSQMDEWYEVFNINETHSLFIPPNKRIRVF